MGFRVTYLDDAKEDEMGEIADRRLYVTADDEVVEEGDPRAAFLLAAPGQPIPAGYAAPKKPRAKARKGPQEDK